MTDATFFEVLTGHATIVELCVPSCEPCKALSPIFDMLARKRATERVHFIRVDVANNPNIATGLGVMTIPTIVVFDSTGVVVERLVGLPSMRRLRQLVTQADASADAHRST